jgi:hypothetical protein
MTEMTTIQVDPQTAELIQSLIARAEAQGISLEELLRPLAEQGIAEAGEMAPADKARAWEEWALSHDPQTPVILDDSRESLYRDDE